MTALKWDQTGERTFQNGIDRGVLYTATAAVPWNGITGIDENVTQDAKTAYLDGVKYLDYRKSGEYTATIKAFTYPREFEACMGIEATTNGVLFYDQNPKPFGISYRTKLGDDVKGFDKGYLIHVVYNLRADPGNNSYSTLGKDADAMEFSWTLGATPVALVGRRPTAHIAFRSTDISASRLSMLENILYGSPANAPSLPDVDTLLNTFNLPAIVIVDNGDGTWSATGPDDQVVMINPETFALYNVDATYLDANTYQLGTYTPVTPPVITPVFVPKKMIVVGNAFGSGYGLTYPKIDRVSSKLAKKMGAVENNISVKDSALTYDNQGFVPLPDFGNGGWVTILQKITANRGSMSASELKAVTQLGMIFEGINAAAHLGSAAFNSPFASVLRTIICRLRAAAIFENDHSSCAYTSGWITGTSALANSGANTRYTSTVGEKVTITVDSSFPGGTIDLLFITLNTDGATITGQFRSRVDGVDKGLTLAADAAVSSVFMPLTKRLTGLAAGAHTITVTYEAGSGLFGFDAWSVEPNPAPPVLIPKAFKMLNYSRHAYGWPAAPINDAFIDQINAVITSVAAEFTDGRVVPITTEDLINKDFTKLLPDGVTPNATGTELIAQRCYDALVAMHFTEAELANMGF